MCQPADNGGAKIAGDRKPPGESRVSNARVPINVDIRPPDLKLSQMMHIRAANVTPNELQSEATLALFGFHEPGRTSKVRGRRAAKATAGLHQGLIKM